MSGSEDSKKRRHESIFEIIDNVMYHLNTTKKMFMIMIVTTLILPPVIVIGLVAVTDSPESPKAIQRSLLLERLKSGDISRQEFIEEIEKGEKRGKGPGFGMLHKQPLHLVLLIVAVFWLGFGIRQWYVLSSWSKKYENYKKRQEELDKKLDDKSEDDGDVNDGN